MKRLPDAGFDIMKVVWASTPPITTMTIMETLGQSKGWKAQTVITLLMRLVELGFLRTEKNGRFRCWFPIVSREEYMQFETANFIHDYYNDSLIGLFTALTDTRPVDAADLEALEQKIRSKMNEEKKRKME